MNIITLVAPRRITIGGWLLRLGTLPDLMESIRCQLSGSLNGYPAFAGIDRPDFVRESTLGEDASLWGMVEMCKRHVQRREARDATIAKR